MIHCSHLLCFFFFNDTSTTEIYTLSLHDALPIYLQADRTFRALGARRMRSGVAILAVVAFASVPLWLHRCERDDRSEEHTSELQSRLHLVCRLLLEKKK